MSVDRVLSALADPTRRRVVELLHDQPRRAGELAEAVDMSPPAMSRHLRVLRTSGLVEEHRGAHADNRVRIYALRRAPFEELNRWLAEIESYWTDQLAAFKVHAEKKKTKRKR